MTAAVTVLTPSFGYARFIADAIESVLQQDGTLEHVVHDGASTDGTVELLKRYDSRIVWRSASDNGQSDALNKAFAKSTGDWIGWLNADEFYLPHAISSLVEQAETTGADVVFGDAALVDEAGRLMRLVPQHRFSAHLLRTYGPYLSSCAVLIRKAALPPEPWHPDMRRVMDWDLYLSLARAGAKFVHLPRPVAAFRVHGAQVTATGPEPGLPDYGLVAARHGIRVRSPLLLKWGRLLHGGYKLVDAGYTRQRAANAFQGRDMRWFDSGASRAAAVAFVRRCSR
jgi:glycosyltransferase involved in cell wall biosynthesis